MGGEQGTGAAAGRASSGKYEPRRVVPWVLAFAAAAAVPLLFMVVSAPPARAFLVELGVAAGFVGIALLALQFLTTGRVAWVAPRIGTDVVLQWHRQVGILAMVVVLAHPVIVILGDRDHLEYFDPRVNLPRAVALVTVVVALVALVATSLRRLTFGLDYERWRLVHGGLAFLVVFIGMVHGIQVGHYLDEPWELAAWVLVLGGALAIVVNSRVLRPRRDARRPYRVVEVVRELPDTTTLVLEPVDHEGMRFEAGQFAWLTVGEARFELQQHPFSFSSGADERRLRFTAKAVGDFTSTWPEIEVGSRVRLEGPYGGLVLEERSRRVVMIAGGIGVTPMVSMLETIRHRGEDREVVVVYGVGSTTKVPFADRLGELAEQLPMDLVIVPEHPPAGWTGPSGLLDRVVLERVLPSEPAAYEYFICGPEPMIDLVEPILRDLGVPRRRIYSERFQIV